MLRARFFQDTFLQSMNLVIRKDRETDVDYDLGLELFKDDLADILNPYENEDLFKDIEKYENDWVKFVEYTKREGV
ncbi:hypothetical protein [Staphylococcus phage PMBT8]|nr:hypothetical protein [Staphylococcus phage PMBT8]